MWEGELAAQLCLQAVCCPLGGRAVALRVLLVRNHADSAAAMLTCPPGHEDLIQPRRETRTFKTWPEHALNVLSVARRAC